MTDDVLTVTMNPAVDHTVRVDSPLESGVVARTDDAQFDAGGKGINVSKYLTALDVSAPATGFLGGPFGRMIRTQLDGDGVPNDFVEIPDRTRLNTTVLSPDAEYKINHDGPTVGEDAVSDLVDRVAARDPDTVLVAGSLPVGVTTAAVDRLARAGEWDTAVDMNGSLLTELDARYLVCKPNREELGEASGRPVDSVDDCAVAAADLRERGFRYVLASLGSDGALLVSESETVHAPAVDAEVVDTVGAGDTFNAAVLAALSRGEPLQQALDAGVRAASLAISTFPRRYA